MTASFVRIHGPIMPSGKRFEKTRQRKLRTGFCGSAVTVSSGSFAPRTGVESFMPGAHVYHWNPVASSSYSHAGMSICALLGCNSNSSGLLATTVLADPAASAATLCGRTAFMTARTSGRETSSSADVVEVVPRSRVKALRTFRRLCSPMTSMT